ncbi:MAG: addiction module protein [Terracidiphilus sp.]|nr:addiction module protein [Terracidiphilus sp.]
MNLLIFAVTQAALLLLGPPIPKPTQLSDNPIRRTLIAMGVLKHDEVARLTEQERLALISQLWDSLESSQLPLTAAQEAELDRRLESLDQDRREGVTWATLRAELESR